MTDHAHNLAAGEGRAPALSARGSFLQACGWDVLLLAVIFAAMVYGIGSYGLYEPHEGHFAGVAREMVLGHDWITPRLDGSPYLNKPPLFYWLIAASYECFGINEWAARFPQVLIGWSGVLLALLWARELWGPAAGRIAAGILGVSAGWYLFSHQLLIDEMLCVLHLASLYFLWKGIARTERTDGWAWFWFYVTLGLSIMAKGLIGFALPIAVLFAYAFLKKDWSAVRRCRPWMGLGIITVLVAPWVIAAEMRNPGFLYYVIVNEHILRLLDKRDPPDYHASQTSFWMFILIAAVWLAPWCLFLPQIVSFGWKNASRRANVDPKNTEAAAVLALGALLPTLLFVFVPSRLIYYSLPTLPPFAVLAAGWWVNLDGANFARGRRAAGITALAAGLAIAIAGQFVGGMIRGFADLAAAPETLSHMPGFALEIGAGLVLGGTLLLANKTSAAVLALCLPIAVGEALNTAGFAAFDPVRSSKHMVAELLPKVRDDCVWISEGSLEIGAPAGTAFYLGADAAGRARFVYVMKSDSPYRRPPSFPGKEPVVYLIDAAELTAKWNSKTPALYVTDLMRTRDRKDDPVTLPPPPRHLVPVTGAGHREVYANDAAWERLSQ